MKPPKLIAITQPTVDVNPDEGSPHHIKLSPEDFITYAARVSNPSNQMNTATAPKLLAYLVKAGHWSPFDMVDMVVEVTTSKAIAIQMLRHWSFRFQEFCVSGSTRVTLEAPGNSKRAAYHRTIEQLYNLQEKDSRRLPQGVRVFDERTRTFVRSKLSRVFQTGVKPTFRIELENGKVIECTKEHRFLTKDGFVPLEYAVGLEMRGSTAVMTRPNEALACNGVVAYRNREWLLDAKNRALVSRGGVQSIADEAGCSYHTIRKWLRVNELQFSKKETASMNVVWNRGVTGYSLPPHRLDTIKKMRKAARRGSESNLWRGGASRSERIKIADWCNANRSEFLIEANYCCQRCERRSNKLELHHIRTVAAHPELAYTKSNIEVLCHDCHVSHHNLNGDRKKWREKSKGNTLTLSWSKVRKVTYLGYQMTYDLEVDHASHNYVGNGIVVHNSQRYAEVSELDYSHVEARRKHEGGNRQGSSGVDDGKSHVARVSCDEAAVNYKNLTEGGIAPESARMVLPMATLSTLYVKGSVRSWMTYFWQRLDPHAQKEHRELAHQIFVIFENEFPLIAELVRTHKPVVVENPNWSEAP